MTYALNSDSTVAVDQNYFWNYDMDKCPTGVKVQLLSIGEVGVYGTYKKGDDFWQAWAPMPKKKKQNPIS